jgi:hypothetical protein
MSDLQTPLNWAMATIFTPETYALESAPLELPMDNTTAELYDDGYQRIWSSKAMFEDWF